MHISNPTKKKRLFLAGYFLCEMSAAKRRFWLGQPDALKEFSETHVLDPSKKLKADIHTLILHTFPMWLSQTKPTPIRLLLGIIELIRFILISPSFLQEISTLEWHSLRLKSKFRLLRIFEVVNSIARYLCGLGQCWRVINNIKLTCNDTVVIWSEHMVGLRIIKKEAQRRGARLIFSEYGEIPNTVFACDYGMFHESWPAVHKQKFQNLPINAEDHALAKNYAQFIISNEVSSKVGFYNSTQKIESLKLDPARPVIYVNGVQEHASGLIPRCSKFSHEYSPHFESNFEALKYFETLGKKNKWTIIYKDHPNTFNHHPNECLKQENFETHVKIVSNLNIYDILSVANITVTLGSKTVFMSLLCEVPVLLLGPYSINQENLKRGIQTGENFEREINQLLNMDVNSRVNLDDFYSYIARLMKYFYYSIESDESNPFGRGKQQFWKDLESYLSGNRNLISTAEANFIQEPQVANIDNIR